MDAAKCRTLKEAYADQPEPHIIPINQFFDGNDDLASIGCNLDPHPGIEVFRDVLVGLLGRSDVMAVYAQISELDPGEGSWPFTDTVLVVGEISEEDLNSEVIGLEPDEVAGAEGSGVSPFVREQHGFPVMVLWWD